MSATEQTTVTTTLKKRGRPRKTEAVAPKRRGRPRKELTENTVRVNMIKLINDLERKVHELQEERDVLTLDLFAARAVVRYLEKKIQEKGE